MVRSFLPIKGGRIALNKKEVTKTLNQIALYLEIKGENPYKVSAYRRAAQALESDERSMQQIENVFRLKGIGKKTAAVIEEMRRLGYSPLLESLKKEVPSGLVDLLRLPGIGGKKIARLYRNEGITDLSTLKKACEEGRLQKLEGFGPKTEEKILKEIETLESGQKRLPLATALDVACHFENALQKVQAICRWSRAGSLRRLEETVKDLDYVVATEDPAAVQKALESIDGVQEIKQSGEKKMSFVYGEDPPAAVDVRIVPPAAFASALHHFTGSKMHNIQLRQMAKERGEKINEYGIEHESSGEIIEFDDERALFSHFGLHYIPPQLRQGKNELSFFQTKISLLASRDIKGDLHMHTTWSDGADTIAEMAEAARARGYEYIAITDHSASLAVAGGLEKERLLRQREEIARLNEQYRDGFTILSGVEMDILKDGRLDYDDQVLELLDFVIASIHSSFRQSQEKIKERLNAALENPHVDLVAHPSGRLIGRRKGYAVDMEWLIERARKTNTALELNANPNRLDLDAKWLALAQEKGVKIVVNTDAHSREALSLMTLGVAYANKGWLRPSTVLNTLSVEELRRFLQKKQ